MLAVFSFVTLRSRESSIVELTRAAGEAGHSMTASSCPDSSPVTVMKSFANLGHKCLEGVFPALTNFLQRTIDREVLLKYLLAAFSVTGGTQAF
jgi:hypothetical protein